MNAPFYSVLTYATRFGHYPLTRRTSPEAWERTEQGCAALEAELKAHGVWEDKELFVNDEYETDGPVTGPKAGWGETISSTFLGGASFLVSRLTGHTAEPTLPTTAPAGPASRSPVAPAPHAEQQPTSPTGLWDQASIAARGIGEAAVQVGGALGQQAQRAVEGLREQAPAPVSKDSPAASANSGAALSPVTSPTTSATTAALDAPAAPSAPAAQEEREAAKADTATDEAKK